MGNRPEGLFCGSKNRYLEDTGVDSSSLAGKVAQLVANMHEDFPDDILSPDEL